MKPTTKYRVRIRYNLIDVPQTHSFKTNLDKAIFDAGRLIDEFPSSKVFIEEFRNHNWEKVDIKL